ALGSIVGFGLDKLAPAPPPVARIEPAVEATPRTNILARTATGVLALGHVRARLGVANKLPLYYRAHDLESYRWLWAAIATWLAAPGDAHRREVESRAAKLGLTVRPIERVGDRDAYAIFELEEHLDKQVGWDTSVLVPGAPGPVIAVPRPAREAPSA